MPADTEPDLESSSSPALSGALVFAGRIIPCTQISEGADASFCCTLQPMRVMGIDCGGEYTGYGVVDQMTDAELQCVCVGAIKLSPRDRLESRLKTIFERLTAVMLEHQPEVVAIEDVFYAANAKSALKLGHVRGVAMLAAAHCGLPVEAYAPLSIKSAVVGYGKAEKSQVQIMVARLLRLSELPQPADAADALAIAICHLHTAATLQRFHASAH